MRAGTFSPNHIGNDAAIFNLTAEALRKRGCSVKVYSEEEFNEAEITEPVIIAMCRRQNSIEKLKSLEDAGCLVVNSGYGIDNCNRERMTRLLIGNGVPYPDSLIVNTNENVKDELIEKDFTQVWIKRGDTTIHREDVSYCRQPDEAQEVLHEYFYRGIKRAVINRHLTGDLIKFYGVRDTDFFYWYEPMAPATETEEASSLYEGVSRSEFIETFLKTTCARISDIMDVRVYGGECIMTADGTIKIIDFNDWPSFAPCRDKASVVIAKSILSLIAQKNGKR